MNKYSSICIFKFVRIFLFTFFCLFYICINFSTVSCLLLDVYCQMSTVRCLLCLLWYVYYRELQSLCLPPRLSSRPVLLFNIVNLPALPAPNTLASPVIFISSVTKHFQFHLSVTYHLVQSGRKHPLYWSGGQKLCTQYFERRYHRVLRGEVPRSIRFHRGEIWKTWILATLKIIFNFFILLWKNDMAEFLQDCY